MIMNFWHIAAYWRTQRSVGSYLAEALTNFHSDTLDNSHATISVIIIVIIIIIIIIISLTLISQSDLDNLTTAFESSCFLAQVYFILIAGENCYCCCELE